MKTKTLYWDANGAVRCEAHIPLKGSDTWQRDAWCAVPAEALPYLGGKCECCEGWVMSTIVTAEVIHDPIDGYTAVIYCPECDGAFGVQTDADVEVADEHVQACSGQANGLEEIDELEDARAKARGMNAEQAHQDARDSWDHVR